MYQYKQGRHTTQGHKGIPEGHFEEEQGRDGFFGPVSHLIKPEPSTRWINIEGPLKPRMYDLVQLGHAHMVKVPLLQSPSCRIYSQRVHKQEQSLLSAYRNADADQVVFVHNGKGKLWTEFGAITFKKGHYLCIPKCVTFAYEVEADTELLIIESRASRFDEPSRGMVGRNAFFDPAVLQLPQLEIQQDLMSSRKKDFLSIYIQKMDELTRFDYSSNVFDVVGWKGDFYPFALHVDDLMPLNSHRVHLPPSAHTTFVAKNFVICTFVPRPLETDVDALKVPFYHQNIDYDEVIFYHDGNFFSRDNLHAGMMSFHPSGFPHGPHPKAIQSVNTKTHTNEYAVMIDSKESLLTSTEITKVELRDYWKSWMAPKP